jgi:ankyrin repeat protein
VVERIYCICSYTSARCGHTDLLLWLLITGNCVNIDLPGDSGTLLHEAARSNHIQTIKTLVDLGVSSKILDANGKTRLHVSAETGCREVAKPIVERQEMPYGEAVSENILTLDRAITKLN